MKMIRVLEKREWKYQKRVLERPVCKDGGISIDANLRGLTSNLQVKVNGLLVKWKSNGFGAMARKSRD